MAQFVGPAYALSRDALTRAAADLGVGVAEVWAVIATETAGCGYLSDRRPCILYERHIFCKLTNGTFSDPDVSCPDPGGYEGGAAEYNRLRKAINLDASAALQSTSWGLGQILGQNHGASGFQTVEAMISAMTESEDAQLLAFTKYLKSRRLDLALRAHDWQTLALKYNGPSYARNKYDQKLASNYEKYSTGNLPDFDIRAAQLYLMYLGFATGSIDGVMGSNTTAAVSKFQASFGLNATGELDAETSARLKEAATTA
jgi:hypothetical protein